MLKQFLVFSLVPFCFIFSMFLVLKIWICCQLCVFPQKFPTGFVYFLERFLRMSRICWQFAAKHLNCPIEWTQLWTTIAHCLIEKWKKSIQTTECQISLTYFHFRVINGSWIHCAKHGKSCPFNKLETISILPNQSIIWNSLQIKLVEMPILMELIKFLIISLLKIFR